MIVNGGYARITTKLFKIGFTYEFEGRRVAQHDLMFAKHRAIAIAVALKPFAGMDAKIIEVRTEDEMTRDEIEEYRHQLMKGN